MAESYLYFLFYLEQFMYVLEDIVKEEFVKEERGRTESRK